MKKNYKSVLKEDVLDSVMKRYADFEVDENTIRALYNNLPALSYKEKTNLYFEYDFMLSEALENYIMKLIQSGDIIREIEMAELKSAIVIRYMNLKGLNIYDTYGGFLKSAEDISDEILSSLKDDYDYNDSMNNQYVKKLKKKFNK